MKFLDGKSLRVYEKFDVSLMTIFDENHNKWNVSTSGTPDASGPLQFVDKGTFKSLFL